MALTTWSIFLGVVLVAVVTPGPAMLAIAGHAVERGPRATMPIVAGNVVGAMAMMGVSVAGLAAFLAAAPGALTVLRVLGAAYLLWAGIRTFRGGDVRASAARGAGVMRGLMIALSNPAGLIFYGAVLPQFVDSRRPLLPQFVILAVTMGALEFAITAAVTVGAGAATTLMASAQLLRRVGGALLVCAAILVAIVPVHR
jgi:threonine/homoserine/homoserine lactone efflux protein